jgi:hypothetical protein
MSTVLRGAMVYEGEGFEYIIGVDLRELKFHVYRAASRTQ